MCPLASAALKSEDGRIKKTKMATATMPNEASELWLANPCVTSEWLHLLFITICERHIRFFLGGGAEASAQRQSKKPAEINEMTEEGQTGQGYV